MRTKTFWANAAERAVRTFAQALVAVLVAGFVFTDAAAWGEAIAQMVRHGGPLSAAELGVAEA